MDRYHQLAEQFLQKFVAFQTVNGGEKALASHIAEILSGYGFYTELQDIAEGRANIVAAYGHSDRVVVFTGHLDVVPAGDGWTIDDPFHVVCKDGRIYGRGTCDMKGGIASMMAAAICLVEQGEIWDCELRLVFVADEEVDGLGTKHYVNRIKPTEDTIVIIGEPTELHPLIAHRGVTRFCVQLFGQQCHSGTPYEGVNAVYAAARFALRIEEFDKSRQNEKIGILPPPNMTVTISHTGVKENVVPGTAKVIIDCRTVPGDTVETLQNSIETILHKLFDGTKVTYELSSFICVPPSSVPEDDIVCLNVKAAYRKICGEEALVTDCKGCCDMAYFCASGYSHTLLMGPGSMAQAHLVDEYIEISQLHRAVDFYAEVVRQMKNNSILHQEGRFCATNEKLT